MTQHQATYLILHGRVQVVFYRDWTVDTARALGITGWVRNLPEGTVEAHLEGAESALAQMVEAMRDGPPRARVDRIDPREAEPQGLASFERR